MNREYVYLSYKSRIRNAFTPIWTFMAVTTYVPISVLSIFMFIKFPLAEGWFFLFGSFFIYIPIRQIWVIVNITKIPFIKNIMIENGKLLIEHYIKDFGPYQLEMLADKNLIIESYNSGGWDFKTPYIELINKKQNLNIKFYSNLNFRYQDMLEIKKAIEIAQGKPQFNYNKYGSGW